MCGSANYGPGFGFGDLVAMAVVSAVNEAAQQSGQAEPAAPKQDAKLKPKASGTQPARAPDRIANARGMTSVRADRDTGTPFARPATPTKPAGPNRKTLLGQ